MLMALRTKRFLLIVVALVYLGCAPGIASGRVLANTNAAALNPANRWANTLRAGATTQQAITEAVESGGNPLATRWAGHVGSEMAYAAAQPDQEVFDAVDREHSSRARPWGKLRALLGANKVDITPADRLTNSIRAQAATSAAIEDAVKSGGKPMAVKRAGHVGNMMSYAASQADQEVFNTIEKEHSDQSWPFP